MGFGDRIKAGRLAKGLSQAKLAEKAGITPAAVSGWETGETKAIDGDNLLAVAKALNLPPEFIMNGKKPIGAEHLTQKQREAIELIGLLTDEECDHVLGLLKMATSTRSVPCAPQREDKS